MSYLDLPRINFFGTFFTNPSTVNNDPSHYDPTVKRPSPWQEPKGMHLFKFTDTMVQAAIDATGALVTGGDPIIGAKIVSEDKPVPAKLADIDVYQQAVTQIIGFSLQITFPDGSTLTGPMDPPALTSVRFSRVLPTRGWQPWDNYGHASFGKDTYAVGFFQSPLRFPASQWPVQGTSALLDQLRAKTITDPDGNILVSCRWVPDSFENVPWNDKVDTGRVVGTLGPILNENESEFSPGARWVDPRALEKDDQGDTTSPWYWPDLYGAPFKVADRGDRTTVVIDLAVALAMETVWGAPVDLGELTAQFGDGSAGPVGPFQANQNFYQALGGIIEMPLTSAQAAAARQPMSIVTSKTDIGGTALWTEDETGRHWEAVDRVFRLTSEPDSPSRTARARVIITQWGVPATGVQLAVQVQSVVNGNGSASVPWSGGYQGNTPQADGALTATIGPSDANGCATVDIEVVKDPGSRTTQLDGQLYFLVVYDSAVSTPDPTQMAPQEQMISALAWSSYPVKRQPTWDDIYAIMHPYSKLYPGMAERIRMDDPHTFQTFAMNPPWKGDYKHYLTQWQPISYRAARE